MEKEYFVIENSDGDTRVKAMTREELLANLKEDGSGYKAENIMNALDEGDTNYWGDDFLIIKGKIVWPHVKETVTEYALD